jgi:RHS repeat-associated protein
MRTQSGKAFDGIGYAPGTQLPNRITGGAGSGTATDFFTYNPCGEVIASVNNQLLAQNRSYTYDPIGNRLNTTEGDLNMPSSNPSAKSYTSNSLNQYTQINTTVPTPPTTVQPTHDDDGNLLTDGAGKTYTWDSENRLTQVTLPNGEIVKYYFDFGSHRIKREHIASTNTTTTTYRYDDWNVIVEEIIEIVPVASITNPPKIKVYLWGLDLNNALQSVGGVGALLNAKTDTNAIVRNSHFVYDANGNASELINITGEIDAHYEYDAFGKENCFVGALASLNTYRFSTKRFDAVTDLVYYGFRFYDPQNGRWINRDPIEMITGRKPELLPEGPNLYAYGGGDPIDRFDADGLAVPVVIGGGVITISALEAAAAAAGISVLACLASPQCRAAAAEIVGKAARKAYCNTIYAADIAACNLLCSKKNRSLCYQKAIEDWGDCMAAGGY